MFLIRLQPSLREVVVAKNHKTAVAMVRAVDALWNAWGSYNRSRVAATMTQRSRSPALANGKKNDKRNGNASFKSHLPSGSDFFSFQNPGNGMCRFHNFYGNKAHKCIFSLAFGRKTKALPNLCRFGSKFNT
jgi:hypothetical protein